MALDGGQGSSWRVGETVLKPLAMAEDELAWQAHTNERIVCLGFRVAAPLRAADGALVLDGWTATKAVSGRHEERRWADIIAAGERFHAALAGVGRPDFLDRRTNPWSVADRVAWGETPADAYMDTKHLPRLTAALRPVHAPSQVVHSDLTGNVLFDEHLPPAIIDFSPYWRPTAYAAAIVVGDALTWEGADETVLDAVAHIEDFGQHLLRAVIFRAVTDRIFRPDARHAPDDADPFMLPVELACRLAATSR
ncbi:MAG: hypothetical protein V7607_2770 [Solirubrobacteraceae bacterium]